MKNGGGSATKSQGHVREFLQCLESTWSVTVSLRYTLTVLFSANLKQQLDDHIEMLPIVRLIRLQERVGVVRARQQGAALATGGVLVFLDSHCECSPGNYFSSLYTLCSAKGCCYSYLVQYFSDPLGVLISLLHSDMSLA